MTPGVFWAKVDTRSADGCWPWQGHCDDHGYGRVGIDSRLDYAHRVAWRWAFGAIPGGMHVLHRCDNPPCVRPGHLFLGTVGDNMRDRAAKGRSARGGRRRPTHPETVAAIRRRLAVGQSQRSIGLELGVPQPTVNQIATGRRRRSPIPPSPELHGPHEPPRSRGALPHEQRQHVAARIGG